MTTLIPVAIFGWVLVMLILFATIKPARAVVVGVVAGWLLLPVTSYSLKGFVDIDKSTAIALSAAIAVLAMDSKALGRFRLGWVDLPMLLWCVAPLPIARSSFT